MNQRLLAWFDINCDGKKSSEKNALDQAALETLCLQ